MNPCVLLIEDEAAIRDMIAFALKRAGIEVRSAPDAHAAQIELSLKRPNLILLDWMLPGTSGLELAKRLKRDELTSEIPIIMLTAKGDEDDRVLGLDSGVDDYVVKPFSTRELISRIRAVLRRGQASGEREEISLGDLLIDVTGQRVSAKGQAITLGPTEYRLLHFLATHPDRVYSRAQLLDHVWGTAVYIEDRTVDVHIGRLRKALEGCQCDSYVQTVRGSGYRFSLKQA
jgi:two-component system, OmpR family, phosphate regulon response regulator PhoB